MTDDWSLKGKEKHWYNGIIYDYKINERAISFYFSEDIETLRQKFIEDTNNFQDKLLARLTSYLSFPLRSDEETISQIANELFREYKEKMNRRFGVEDEK